MNSPIDEIKSRLDIVDVIGGYLKLQKTGINYRAVCPFHSEKNPSFFVSPSRQSWRCFGCSVGGDVFKFVMMIEGIDFGDALRLLAKKAGVKLSRQNPKIRTQRQRLYGICERSCRFFEAHLQKSKKGQAIKAYFEKRGISEQSQKEWRLGFSPETWHGLVNFLLGKGYKREEIVSAGLAIKSEKKESYYDRFRGRIMFPVFDLSSQVVGFGGRITEEQKEELKKQGKEGIAKYINVPQTPLYNKSGILYGLDKAKVEIRKKDQCVLVEGYTDVIMSRQADILNVAAASGTALTPYHLDILKRYSDNLVLAFDMDIAGDTATKRGIDLAQEKGFNIKVAMLPKGLDPADVILENKEEWGKAIASARSIMDFYFETAFEGFQQEDKKLGPEEKRNIAKILLPAIKKIPNKILQSHWVQTLADKLKVGQQDVLEELEKVKETSSQFGSSDKAGEKAEKTKTRKDLLEERLLAIAAKDLKLADKLEENDFDCFSPQACQSFSFLKTSTASCENPDFFKNAPSGVSEFLNNLLFKMETGIFQFQDAGKEFDGCLREIRTIGLKEKLKKVSLDLREAEEANDDKKIQDLAQEFKNLSQKLIILEK